MIHLTLNQISAYIDGELPEASVELVRLHLSSCLECTERFGHIEEQESALARLLVHAPGDPFFERFTERVLGPIPVKKTEPAAAVTKAEPAVAKKPEPAPTRKPPEAAAVATAPKRTGSLARVLLPAGALLLVGSAVAVLATRPQVAARWRGNDPVTVRGTSGTGNPEAGPQHTPPIPPAPAGAGPAGGDGSDLLEAAAARSAAADRAGTAEEHDAAAAAWEKAIPELQDDADELAAGRREIAVARYAAWIEGATPERRQAAMRAVRAYLLCAPAGPERDRAWGWLAQLKR